jgi:ribose transport system permease protein
MSTTPVNTQAPGSSKPARILPPLVSGQEWALVGVLVVLWILLGIFTPAFLTPNSIQPLLGSVAPIALIGVGMTFIIITAGIDISVGAAIMVTAVISAKLMVEIDLPLWGVIPAAITVGLLLGLVNGLLVAYGGVHAIIITFGTLNLFQYLGLRIFGSQTVNGIPGTLDIFGNGSGGRVFGVPVSFVIAVIVMIFGWWFLRNTAWGRSFYAIGGNQNAARLAGIPVQRRVLSAYVITGGLVGLGALMVVAQGTNSLMQNVGQGRELAVIAAVVIGGTTIMGGRGSVFGTLLGAILVQTVVTGVTQLGWPSNLANFFVGLFIIISVGADILRAKARKKSS